MEMLLRLNREGPSGTAYALMKNGSVIDISDEEVYRLTNDRSEKINVIPVAIILAQMNFNHA